MKKIIQITDPHICPKGESILGIDPAERFRTLIASVNGNHNDAEHCIITGDLTDKGDIGSYRYFHELVSALTIPCRFLLGNHDRRDNFRYVFPTSPVDSAGYIQDVVELAEFVCLHLDTLDEDYPAQGVLCVDRMMWLASQLDRFKARRIVLFMHHPLLSIGMPWFDQMLVANGQAVADLINSKGNVVHIVFGHVHVNVCGTWHGITYSGSRGSCHKIVYADASGTSAEYADHGPAYDILYLGSTGVCVHTIDPAGPTRLIGRESVTPDGKWQFKSYENERIERWL